MFDFRRIDDRDSEAAEAFDRARSARSEAASRMVVQVYSGTSAPTTTDKVYLCHPVRMAAPPVEGSSYSADPDSNRTYHVVFVHGVPTVGGLYVAHRRRGQWVAEAKPVTTVGCATCAASTAYPTLHVATTFSSGWSMSSEVVRQPLGTGIFRWISPASVWSPSDPCAGPTVPCRCFGGATTQPLLTCTPTSFTFEFRGLSAYSGLAFFLTIPITSSMIKSCSPLLIEWTGSEPVRCFDGGNPAVDRIINLGDLTSFTVTP